MDWPSVVIVGTLTLVIPLILTGIIVSIVVFAVVGFINDQ